MAGENLKKIVQNKTVPWLRRAQAFEDQQLPVDTPQYILDIRRTRIDKDKKIEDRLREYAPHAGATLDVLTGDESQLGLIPLLPLLFAGVGTAGIYTVLKWFKKSDAEHELINRAVSERERVEAVARAEQQDEAYIQRVGRMAFEKTLGVHERNKMLRHAMYGFGFLAAGYLILRITTEVKK